MEVRDMDNTISNEEEDVKEIDLFEVFHYVWERIWIVIICMLMCGGAAYVLSNYFMTEYYRSSMTVWVVGLNDTSSSITYSDIQVNSQMANDYVEIITSRSVLEEIIGQLELEETVEGLRSRISASKKTDTRMITISVMDTAPERAQAIANAVYEVASRKIAEVMKAEQVSIQHMGEADLPGQPSSPNVRLYTVLGALAGIVVSVMLIVLLFVLDDTIRTDEDVEKYLGFSPLASIPRQEDTGRKSSRRNEERDGQRDTVKVKKKLVSPKDQKSFSKAE